MRSSSCRASAFVLTLSCVARDVQITLCQAATHVETGRQVLDLSHLQWSAQRAAGGEYPAPPPPPDCVFVRDVQLSDPGSKHTKPPVATADEDACCQVCMADRECFGAELYGTSCYVKTAPLPQVKQQPPRGVPLVACVRKNNTVGLGTSSWPVVPATVPGDILAALERSDALGIENQSIYFGTNLKSPSVQAAQNASYWLNATVPMTARDGFLDRNRHTLVVDGLDYNATIFLNGQKVGSHAGPYNVCRLMVPTGLLESPTNELAILFHMPPAGLIGGWLAPGNGVQGVMWNFLDYWKSMVGIGYDFGQPLWSIGIQERAQLVATDHILITDLMVLPTLEPPYSEALINASCTVDADTALKADVEWSVTRLTSSSDSTTADPVVAWTTASLHPGRNLLSSGESLTVLDPSLWYPKGIGNQPLYTLTVTVSRRSSAIASTSGANGTAMDSLSRPFGIRDLKQVRNPQPLSWTYIEEFYCGPGEHGDAPPDGGANCTFPEALVDLSPEQIDANRNWTFQINGRRVFARGANWLPCDMRISECHGADYDYLIGTAADANMNFLRVWGGGGIEKQAFYDACDREGIMVYQETMHSQAMPVRDVNYINEAGEVEQMISKVSSHPSVVRYGWGNEYYGVNHSSNRFERQYEDITNHLDGTRRATHGSPVTWADRHGPYCFYLSTVGTGQASFPCYQQAAYAAYNYDLSQLGPNSTSVMNQEGPNDPMEWDEYGAAGSSSEYTITQFISQKALSGQVPLNGSQPDLIFHRAFNAVGPGKMWLSQDAYLPLFGTPDSLATEVKISQWAQAEGLRYANQAHRRHMPHRSMCAFWTLNEPWPNAAYGSVVDWLGVKKNGYYTATRKVYSEVDVSLTYSTLFLIPNETLSPITPWVVAERSVEGTLLLGILTTDGKSLHQQSWSVNISVARDEMGTALELPSPVSWTPTAELAGEVLLFRLALLSTSSTDAETSNNVISSQLYTFAVLQPGASAHDRMDSVRPMRPLLQAPTAQCALSKPICGDTMPHTMGLAAAGSCTVVLRNVGATPCLYIELQLRVAGEVASPAEQPQFYGATFSDNFVTLTGGESTTIEFRRRKFRGDEDPGRDLSELQLCAMGWNAARTCVKIS